MSSTQGTPIKGTLKYVRPRQQDELIEMGYDTLEKVAEAPDTVLLGIFNIGPEKVKKIRAWLNENGYTKPRRSVAQTPSPQRCCRYIVPRSHHRSNWVKNAQTVGASA